MAKGWQAWLRNGRLATIALAIVFVTWLCFQLFATVQPPILDNVFLYAVGVWFGNLALGQGRKDEEAARDVDKRVGQLETESDERGERNV